MSRTIVLYIQILFTNHSVTCGNLYPHTVW